MFTSGNATRKTFSIAEIYLTHVISVCSFVCVAVIKMFPFFCFKTFFFVLDTMVIATMIIKVV